MPCYADTIVRIKLVRQSIKEESNLIVVWALGEYPVGRDDYEIEMVLFVSTNSNERDFETQAVFERDHFYSVGGKIVPAFYGSNKRPKMTVSISTKVAVLNRVAQLNKCPLKISLIGIPQELPQVPENDENAIFNILVNDYAIQDHNFMVKVVFPHSNSRLAHLKSTIRPHDSLVFVVGQMEVVDNDFYVYAKDVNFVDVGFLKRKNFDDSGSSSSTEVVSTIRSKILSTHRNIHENSKDSKDISKVEGLSSAVLTDGVLLSDSNSSKCIRVEDDNESIESTNVLDSVDNDDYVQSDVVNNFGEVQANEVEGALKCKNSARNASCGDKKGKDYVGRSLRS
ncbi:24370_t:CDS:2, partial [Dentiscutata erythropus]